MLIQCQRCGAKISDTAPACPKCASGPAQYLGPAAPCAECNSTYLPAYSSCAVCGAPRQVAEQQRKGGITLEPLAQSEVQVSQPAQAVAAQAEAFASPEPEAIYIKLDPMRMVRRFLRWSICLYVAILVLHVGLGAVILWHAATGAGYGPLPFTDIRIVDAIDLVEPKLNACLVFSFFATAAAFVMFTASALSELRGAPAITTSPVFGSLSGLIPIANLVVPFSAMTQIWRASHGYAKRDAAPPGNFAIWWACWLAAGALRVVNDNAVRQQTIAFDAAVVGYMLSNLLQIVAALQLLWIAGRIGSAFDVGQKLIGHKVDD